ncbi:hypothetical protein DSO57_1023109 [Entomophthora muscae]|uniref:Uncharacterized protein n=2 Tax=Entomophthora muscae TaxID=34485 RepID=A0ACC2STN4_9FUNG|nr:hypothetical protein DSO57_1016312 [Entomophthora muscae]KAJ9080611.1 hypothetical protein DSO57_1023109 [Entomophthora muscae]
MKLLFAVLPALLAGARYHCVKPDIKRHIRSGEYTYFWITLDPPGSAPREECEGPDGCCVAGYCFKYLKKNWFSFDMRTTFPNNLTSLLPIVYNWGEMTNDGPWDYTSTEQACIQNI